MKTVDVQISGRKDVGYPTLSFNVTFESVEELISKIDRIIEEETTFGKVDIVVDDYDSILTEDESAFLEKNFIYIS